MTKTDKALRWAEVLATVIFALAAVAALVLYVRGQGETAVARATVPCYTNPGGAAEIVDSGCTLEVKSGGTLTVDSGATESHAATMTVSGALASSGLLSAAGGETLTGLEVLTNSVTTAISLTDGAAFTPTASFQPIQSAGTVTPTITAGFAAGTILVLENASNTTINLADSGSLKLTGALALGQFDTLALISDGVNWIELSTSNN